MSTRSLSEAAIASLRGFESRHAVRSKGSLATVLFMTRRMREEGLPFPLAALRTKNKGQVAGLGKDPVQKILADHKIGRILAEEGGRTSRGSLGLAEAYAKEINKLHGEGSVSVANIGKVEEWWADRVRGYFNQQCFKLEIDPGHAISTVVSLLLREARRRQHEMTGTKVEGAVLQHLVGAKLELLLGPGKISHRSSSTADAPGGRSGDFQLGDAAIHVTTFPGEALLRKCDANIKSGSRPVIVCPRDKVPVAVSLADGLGLRDRVEIYEAEAFISTNVNEMAKFATSKLRPTVVELLQTYNAIVAKAETDQSLKIEWK